MFASLPINARFWLSRYRTDTLSSYRCFVASSLQITQNSLPHCTGSSSGNSMSPISTKFCSTSTSVPSENSVLTKYETQHKSYRNSSSAQRYDGASRISYMITVYHVTSIFYKYRRCTNFVQVSQTTTFIYCDGICIVSNSVLLLIF